MQLNGTEPNAIGCIRATLREGKRRVFGVFALTSFAILDDVVFENRVVEQSWMYVEVEGK